MHVNNSKKNTKTNKRKAAAAAAKKMSNEQLVKIDQDESVEKAPPAAVVVTLPGTHTGQTETDLKSVAGAKLVRHVSFDMSNIDDEVPTTSKALSMQKQHDIEIENIMKLVRLGVTNKEDAKMVSSDSDSDEMDSMDSDGFWNKNYYATPGDVFKEAASSSTPTTNTVNAAPERRVKIDESLFSQPQLSEIADELSRSSLRLPSHHSMQMDGQELADSFEQMNSMLMNFTENYTQHSAAPTQRSPSRKRKNERDTHLSMPRVHRSRFEEFYEQRNKRSLKITGKRPLHIPGKHSNGSVRSLKLTDAAKQEKNVTAALTPQHSTDTLKAEKCGKQAASTCPEHKYLHSILMSVAPMPNEIEQIAIATMPPTYLTSTTVEQHEMFESIAYAEAENVLRIATIIKEADELVRSDIRLESSPTPKAYDTHPMLNNEAMLHVETRIDIESDNELEWTDKLLYVKEEQKENETSIPAQGVKKLPNAQVLMATAPVPVEVQHVALPQHPLVITAAASPAMASNQSAGFMLKEDVESIYMRDAPALKHETEKVGNTAAPRSRTQQRATPQAASNAQQDITEILEPLRSSGTLVDDCFVRSYYRANDYTSNMPTNTESVAGNVLNTPAQLHAQAQLPTEKQSTPTSLPNQHLLGVPAKSGIPCNTGLYHYDSSETPLPLTGTRTQTGPFHTINIDATAGPLPRRPPIYLRMWRIMRDMLNAVCLCLQVNRDCIFCLGFFIAFVVSASFLTAFFYRTLSLSPHIYHRPADISQFDDKPMKVYKLGHPQELQFQIE